MKCSNSWMRHLIVPTNCHLPWLVLRWLAMKFPTLPDAAIHWDLFANSDKVAFASSICMSSLCIHHTCHNSITERNCMVYCHSMWLCISVIPKLLLTFCLTTQLSYSFLLIFVGLLVFKFKILFVVDSVSIYFCGEKNSYSFIYSFPYPCQVQTQFYP